VHLLSGALLTVNWLVFVWAVNEGRIVETALGYFLTPLVNVALGMIFLRERLRAAQGVALAIATAGVVLLIVRLGQFPWVALALAATFGSYGLLRKKSTLGSLSGLTLETTLMLPLALGFLAWRHLTGLGALGEIGAVQTALVISSGIVTAVPLLLFAQGARLIRLSTVGLLQYIAPSVQFAIGVLIYAEPMPPERMWAFVLIWTALAIYSADSVWASRRAGQEMR
jgi:chloramphenicol-sensitive protein RarD